MYRYLAMKGPVTRWPGLSVSASRSPSVLVKEATAQPSTRLFTNLTRVSRGHRLDKLNR